VCAQGAVQLFTPSGGWGTVCGAGGFWDSLVAADVVCKQLGN
jgi:hypothetical protein